MATVNLPDDLVNQAKRYAKMESRSVPRQIEYWAKIGRAAKDNPDLPVPFIMELLESLEDPVSIPFNFSTRKTNGKSKKRHGHRTKAGVSPRLQAPEAD